MKKVFYYLGELFEGGLDIAFPYSITIVMRCNCCQKIYENPRLYKKGNIVEAGTYGASSLTKDVFTVEQLFVVYRTEIIQKFEPIPNEINKYTCENYQNVYIKKYDPNNKQVEKEQNLLDMSEIREKVISKCEFGVGLPVRDFYLEIANELIIKLNEILKVRL
jgi:hypothetical protein